MRGAFAVALLALAGCASAPERNPWAEKSTVVTGASEPIGGTDAGCLQGAVSLPPAGPGFVVMRPSRGRFYAHPSLRDFLARLGAEVDGAGFGELLIGDTAMARGGPFSSGHASHQTGLDADVWFRLGGLREAWSIDAREHTEAPWFTRPDELVPDPSRWGRPQWETLRVAASSNSVERIFVNPALKRDLCARFRGAAWLRKIRPWWGHQEHFHVRLACPVGASRCVAQAPVPPGDGCDATLDWWFTAEAREQGAKPSGPRRLPRLPDACAELLESP